MSEEVAAADAALTALYEAQKEVARLSKENDRLLIELEQALSIGRTLQAENDRLRAALRHAARMKTIKGARQIVLDAIGPEEEYSHESRAEARHARH